MTQTQDTRPEASRPGVKKTLPADFRRYAVALATGDEWAVWAEFADKARWCLAPTRTTDSALSSWRAARVQALTELAELGLAGTVVRTDSEVPLGGHEADLAGLVRVHAVDGPRGPGLPAWAWHGQHGQAKHALRMLAAHGLTPCIGIPTGLRAFCGQHTGKPHRPEWMDHAYTWQDADGLPVLTVEPYRDDPAQLADEVRAYAEGLPVEVDGPHPGVWNDGTVLVILRYGERTPLPAERYVYNGYFGQMVAA